MTRIGDYEIDTSPARVDLDAVWQFLHEHAYWGTWRTREDVRRQVEGAWRVVVREMIDHGPGRDFRWMLHTADAHDLYQKFGFTEPNSTFMQRQRDRSS